MAKKLYEEENIYNIACALRTKCGDNTATYKTCDMAEAITNLPSGDTDIEDSLISGWSNPLTEYTNDRVTNLRSFAFAQCSQLTSISLPNLNGGIAQYCFYNCKALTTVDLPKAALIDIRGFENCSNLTDISLPAVTSVGQNAFYGCSALKTADFLTLSSLINQYAFYNCSVLTALILRSETMPTLYDYQTFYNTPIASGTGYIYVPAALVDTYKADGNWSTYAAQFRALENYTVDGTTTGALDPTKI